MSNTIILNNNFIDEDVFTQDFVSSENATFPLANTYNFKRRSKVWRTAGHWTITSTNQLIKYQETIGVNISLNLTVGEYTDTTLFAHIKAVMEAGGSSTYTIDRDATTNKIKFTSDGSGGAGDFVLKWDDAFELAALLGFDVTVHTGVLTYTAEDLRIHEDEYAVWDFGLPTNPKAFALIGPRNTPIRITPSATIKLEGNETNVWTGPSFTSTQTYFGDSIFEFDTAGLHTEGLRYWRVQVTDVSNSLGFVEVGSLYLGDIFTSDRGAAQFPFRGNYIDNSVTVFSDGGQSFSDIKQKTEQFSLNWFGLETDKKEEIDDFFNIVGTAKPFFVVVDTLGTSLSSRSNYYLRYVKFRQSPTINMPSPGNYRIVMNLREEI